MFQDFFVKLENKSLELNFYENTFWILIGHGSKIPNLP